MGALTRNQENALAETRSYLGERMKQFEAALPSHIKPERFLRTVLTALMIKPELLGAPVETLLAECLKAASDGLMPDGKEAALVPRFGRNFTLAYQPMIAGIRKKARNSGEISSWDCHVVKDKDAFDFGLGFEPFVEHRYDIRQPRGETIGFYSVCVMKDGTKSLDVMSLFDVNRIRDKSDAYKAFKDGKIKSTPWAEHPDEMGLKTVARHHSKVLPTSSDLDRLLYEGESDMKTIEYGDITANANGGRTPATLANKLDALVDKSEEDEEQAGTGDGAKDGEVIPPSGNQNSGGGNRGRDDRQDDRRDDRDGGRGDQDNDGVSNDDIAAARRAGYDDRKAGKAKRTMPAKYRNDERLSGAYVSGFDEAAE